MKLWKKLSLVCSGILILIVLVCSILLLAQSKNSILEITYEQARNKQKSLASSFSEMAGYYSDESDLATTQYALVKYCFLRFADSSSVLMKDGELIYSEVSILPTDYLPVDTYEQQQYTGEIGGRNMLMIGSQVTVKSTPYLVYVVMDISTVYNSIMQMAWRFTAIGFAAIALGAGLIVLLVRRATRPLHELSASTKRIAAGNYEERAAVQSHDEIGALANDFNAMASAVEQHVAQLMETALRQQLFIGGVTHEFKTPLTTILLNADTLQNTFVNEEERQRSLAYIERQCNWLERLTQKLLKLITLQSQIEVKEASVLLLLERVHESMAETLAQRETPLQVDCNSEALLMDIDLMQSVLVNLVDNASKASKPGQPIIVRAYDNIIEVRDQGNGIPESELARITEPFYMVDKSRSKKAGGSGLGLALVKEIVAAHGAELHIESEFGVGTVARIVFSR
ncbi:HAMP domain-containing histidine kinase [Eubacteriales bacterium OttesenSCG-928-K08]|nr:HAMP domain-containing histidine kinase [Eubacteriales bacterium OttesenSCG-928-K08]